VAEEAGQVHGHMQLGADPAALGQLPTRQGAAGQLDQGIGAALITAALIVGAGAGQGVQGRGQELAGLGLQQPLEGDHAVQGRSHPQPPPPMALLGLASGALGVGGLEQVANGAVAAAVGPGVGPPPPAPARPRR
jgi:hypothetical protein